MQNCKSIPPQMAIIIFLALSLLLQGVLGEIVCDELPVRLCSFSIASSGKRCSLETSDRPGVLQCTTSEIVMNNLSGHIETDDCINRCGLHRTVVGISSDYLLEADFIAKICSKECHNNCPNIVDLYSNLASAEGGSLQKMCEAQENRLQRGMSQLRSSGMPKTTDYTVVAIGPVSSGHHSKPPTAPGPISSKPHHKKSKHHPKPPTSQGLEPISSKPHPKPPKAQGPRPISSQPNVPVAPASAPAYIFLA